MRGIKDYFLLFLKGMGMGGADVIPGVSGGTIAFITGIYEELLNSIRAVNIDTISILLKADFKLFWRSINGNFLLAVLGGIMVSIFTLAKVITFFLDNFPIQLWSFFFGLIIISALVVAREIRQWDWKTFGMLIIGIVVAYVITSASPSTTPDNLLFVFGSGMIAICAMILPGISGSFILLILGKYEQILSAAKEFDIITLVVFGLGCIIGILAFARFISWLLDRFHAQTIAVLVGFMIGSLNKIWPWKEVLQYRINSKGERVPFLEENVLPNEYLEITGTNPFVLQALLFFFLGIGIVVVIEKVARIIQQKP